MAVQAYAARRRRKRPHAASDPCGEADSAPGGLVKALTSGTTVPPPRPTQAGSRATSRRAAAALIMFAVGVTVGIASAIVTGAVYGVATVLESGLQDGLRAALVNGTVNGIGAGLAFGLMHGFATRFTAGHPVSGLSRPPDASRFTALLLMIATGLVIGAGYRLVLGSVPGLAAGLIAAVGVGTMTAWGRWLVLARIWPPLSRQAAGKQVARGGGDCACRESCPRHATRRYLFIMPLMRACLLTWYG